MKARRIQLLLIVAVLGVSILFSSVGKTKNIDQRAFVHAIGIDYEDGEYNVSLQVFKPQGAGSDTPVDVVQSNVQVIQAKGKTVKQGIDKVQNKLGRNIFLGHLQLICLSKNVDFSNPEDLFSFCLKDKNVFLGVKLCLAENTALGLMETQITRGTMTSQSFMETIEMNVKNSTTLDCELIDFLSCIKSPSYIAMPVLSKAEPEKKEETSSGGESGKKDGGENNQEPEIQIKSTALVKNGKVLKDEMTNSESEGAAWLTKNAKYSQFAVSHRGENVNVRLSDDGAKIKLLNKDGRLIYKADIKVVANVSKDIVTKEESAEISNEIKNRLEKIFKDVENKALYENKTDIFGIWRLMRHSYPKSYLEYKDRLEDIYDYVDFRTNVDVRIQ